MIQIKTKSTIYFHTNNAILIKSHYPKANIHCRKKTRQIRQITSLWSVGLRQISWSKNRLISFALIAHSSLSQLNGLYTPFVSPVPGGQKPQRGTNGRCSTLVEESNGVQAAVNDR